VTRRDVEALAQHPPDADIGRAHWNANREHRITGREISGRQIRIQRIPPHVSSREKKAMAFFSCGEVCRYPHSAAFHERLYIGAIRAARPIEGPEEGCEAKESE
jgi:hypothetical protein